MNSFTALLFFALVVTNCVAMYEEEEATNQLRRRLRCPRFCPQLSCEPGEKIYRPRPRGLAGCMCPACMSDVCALPKTNGRFCKGRIRRFFFNSDTQKCEKFVFKGCFGNGNNFRSMKQCEKLCSTGDSE